MLTSLSPSEMQTVGLDLRRPESVLATASGRLFTSDHRGGVLEIRPDGSQHLSCRSSLVPNGIALMRDGGFLVANLSEEGGVWRIDPDGTLAPWLMEVGGEAIGRVNFVLVDAQERVWVCVSATEGGDKYPLRTATGRILMDDGSGPRIVADGLHYTNECRVSADGKTLYVNETFGRRLSRFRISLSGELSSRETFARFAAGDFPDGLALDVEGGVWVVCIGSNRVYRVDRSGEVIATIDDAVGETVERLETAFTDGTLDRPTLTGARGHRLANITSIAFGGADLKTAYLGSINGDSLATFRSAVAGFPPAHWHWA